MKCLAPAPLLLLVVLLGCGGGAADATGALLGIPVELEIEFVGGPICCAENPGLGLEIGQLRITHVGPSGSPAWTVDIGPWMGGPVVYDGLDLDAETDPSPVRMESGEVLLTKVFRATCNWSTVTSDIRFTDALNARYVQRIAINNSCVSLVGLFDVVEGIAPRVDPVAAVRDSVIRAVVSVAVPWSAPRVDPQVPIHLWSDIVAYGLFVRSLLLGEVAAAFGTVPVRKPSAPASGQVEYPCGPGVRGFTVCPSMPLTMTEGDYVFAYFSVDEDIPLDSNRLITYGFVFDGDGVASDNYVPHPAYPDDYFKDTDRWYTLEYAPVTGWTLLCRDATNSTIAEVPTGAKAVIAGNVVLLIIPATEFTVSDPRYRVTAFTHTGDFGENPPHDWSGDQHPRVAEGLAPFARDMK